MCGGPSLVEGRPAANRLVPAQHPVWPSGSRHQRYRRQEEAGEEKANEDEGEGGGTIQGSEGGSDAKRGGERNRRKTWMQEEDVEAGGRLKQGMRKRGRSRKRWKHINE
eukprot:GHVU01034208.1.p3 GENE.GHVU01034208.1~~GHVU01034208.1.p3  ORF type:complete len:109 (-),score=27.01 GHVU01034208.1:687-1013(-)